MINLTNLHDVLTNNIVMLSFTKKDGSIRSMQATLKNDLVPEHKEASFNQNVMSVYSIEDKGWRSFRKENFISAEVI